MTMILGKGLFLLISKEVLIIRSVLQLRSFLTKKNSLGINIFYSMKINLKSFLEFGVCMFYKSVMSHNPLRIVGSVCFASVGYLWK